MTARRVQRIVEQEREAMEARVVARVTPMLQAEVDRLGRKFPDFEGVVVGMGSFAFCFEPDRFHEPKAFGKLREMLNEVLDYGIDDLRPSV